MSQKARLTWRKTPSVVITTRPTQVRSNASRTRSKSIRGSRAMVLTGGLSNLARGAASGFHRGAPQRGAEAGAKPLRKLLEDILLGSVVDDFLGLDHLARHILEAAERIREAELDALLARPDEPGERLGRFLQSRPAALAHNADELLVD